MSSRGGHEKIGQRYVGESIVCKEQWLAPNIRGEKFLHVGRTIFIKSKMLLFPYTLTISTQIVKKNTKL